MTRKLGPLQQQWVDALRSGEYKQGIGQLRDDQDQYCCLGVLCDVLAPDSWELEQHQRNAQDSTQSWSHGNGLVCPDRSVLDSVGLDTLTYAKIKQFNQRISLFSLNDIYQWTFDQVADSLETEPEKWFREAL